MTLKFEKYGEGEEKIIFIHGWMTDHHCFDSLLTSIDPKIYTCVLADQRGYGQSIAMEGPYDINQVASDLFMLVDQLNWSGFHAIGHSMGGKVVQHMMTQQPDRIKSFTGITPVPGCPIPMEMEGLTLFARAEKDPSARTEVFQLATAGKYADFWYQHMVQTSMETIQPEAFRSYLDSWVKDDFSEAIRGCTIPTLIITGENDADITADLAKATFGAWLTNVDILTLPGCGHFPMYETPLALATSCQRFLHDHSVNG